MILVAQPRNPHHPPALHAKANSLLATLERDDLSIEIAIDDSPVIVPEEPKYSRHAVARNHLIDTRLRDEHTHVLWIDSDLIDYPADLPSQLWAASDEGRHIVAPIAILDYREGENYGGLNWRDRFYDVGGFIENGRRARMRYPWFDQRPPVYELDSVGCCYLIPAWIYRDGARYAPPPTALYVEHMAVMRYAKAQGVRILALHEVRAVHAWLPDYGLEVN